MYPQTVCINHTVVAPIFKFQLIFRELKIMRQSTYYLTFFCVWSEDLYSAQQHFGLSFKHILKLRRFSTKANFM